MANDSTDANQRQTEEQPQVDQDHSQGPGHAPLLQPVGEGVQDEGHQPGQEEEENYVREVSANDQGAVQQPQDADGCHQDEHEALQGGALHRPPPVYCTSSGGSQG